MLHGQACAEFEERLTRPIDEFIQDGSPRRVSDGAIHVHKTSLTQVFACMSGLLLLLACTDLAAWRLGGSLRVEPYLGGGAGVTGYRLDDFQQEFPEPENPDWCLRPGQRPDPCRTVKRPPGSRYRGAYGRAIQYMQPGPAPSPIGISRVTSSVFKSTTATRSAALSPR